MTDIARIFIFQRRARCSPGWRRSACLDDSMCHALYTIL